MSANEMSATIMVSSLPVVSRDRRSGHYNPQAGWAASRARVILLGHAVRRWAGLGPVPFVGALHGAEASQGIFITTSSFSADARIYAERVNARIVLIDGTELAELTVEHNCGVRVEDTFVLKEVDEDFFDES